MRAAGQGAGRALRGHRRGLQSQVRRILAHCGLPFEEALPAVPPDPAPRTDRQLRASPPAPVHACARALATLRESTSGRGGKSSTTSSRSCPTTYATPGSSRKGQTSRPWMALRTSIVRLTESTQLVHGRGRRSKRWTVTIRPPRRSPTARTARARSPGARRGSGRGRAFRSARPDRSAARCIARSSRPFAAPRVAQRVRLGVVEQHAVTERPRVVRARRQLGPPSAPRVPLKRSMPPVCRPVRYMPPSVQCTLLRCSLLSMQRPVLASRIEGAPP